MKRFLFSLLAVAALGSAAHADPLAVLTTPPATEDERAVFESEIKQKGPQAIREFIIVRKWVRTLKHPNTPRPKEFKWEYTVSVADQLEIFKLSANNTTTRIPLFYI